MNLPQYPPLPKPEPPDTVAKSIANPNAFAKPGTMGTRFRPLTVKRPPGRPRKHKPDPRKVYYY